MILSQQCVLVRNLRILHKHQNIQVFLELSQWPFSTPAGWVTALFPLETQPCPFCAHCLWSCKNATGILWIFSLSWKEMVTTRSSVSHRWETLSRSLSRGENRQESHPWEQHSSVVPFLWPRAITHKAEAQYNGVSRFLMPLSSLQGRLQSTPRLLQHCFDEGQEWNQ